MVIQTNVYIKTVHKYKENIFGFLEAVIAT